MPLHNLFFFSLLYLLKFHNLDPQSFSPFFLIFAPHPTWKRSEQQLWVCLGAVWGQPTITLFFQDISIHQISKIPTSMVKEDLAIV